MRVEIRRLQQSLATTSIYVTHDQVEAMTLADRLVVMNAGVAEQIGTPLALYERPATIFVAGFIGSPAMNFLSAVPAGGGWLAPGHRTLTPYLSVDGAVRATAAGATIVRPVAFGYRWWLATRKETLLIEELRRRSAAYLKQQKSGSVPLSAPPCAARPPVPRAPP